MTTLGIVLIIVGVLCIAAPFVYLMRKGRPVLDNNNDIPQYTEPSGASKPKPPTPPKAA